MTNSQDTVIRIGDRFRQGDTVYEVIGTKPGGKIELFDRARTRFTDRYHRDVKHWERVAPTVTSEVGAVP